MNKALLSTGKNDWETPQNFFDKLNNEFHFTLDPCADDNNHKCNKYYTKEQDGLKQDWSGEIVYCNPPYSNKEQNAWVKKCYEESKHAKVVMLIPSRTDTKRFHEYILPYAEIRFLQGRLTLVGAKDPSPFPNMVVIFRPEVKKDELSIDEQYGLKEYGSICYRGMPVRQNNQGQAGELAGTV